MGNIGDYWSASSSYQENAACGLHINDSYIDIEDGYDRYCGFAVRLVQDL